MYHTEKIAILLATYNGEKYIAEQINSILEQTEKEWVLYIHDDGSTDGTKKIIKEYAQRYPKQIFVVEGKSTGGAKQNFFYLFSQVDAPYYMCCDQDDVWLPKKIELTKKEMNRLEQEDKALPCLVFTELKVADERLHILSDKMSVYQGLDCRNLSLSRALIQNVVTGCTMMVNRAMRDEFHKITDDADILMHDWWALLVATKFGKVSFVETPSILYRQHSENGVGAKNTNSVFYLLKRMLQGSEIRQSLANTREQARYFAFLYNEKEDSLIYNYAVLGRKNKIIRLMFYQRYDVKKSTLAKNIGLFLWG